MKYLKIVLFSSPSLQWLHPILSANCRYNLPLFRLFSGNNSGIIGINLHRQHVFHIVMLWKGAKSHVAQEISGRGRGRGRDEKGNQGVGDFRFINILQLVSICFFFFYTFFTHDIYPHPHSRPTTSTHYPRPTTFSTTSRQGRLQLDTKVLVVIYCW